MASYYPSASAASAAHSSNSSTPMANSHAPPGTFVPGTKVQVGGHRVVIEKYLSEGGFAHVYVVRVPTSSGSTYSAVLKRVAVPDKEALANMRTEVETMKKLKGHKHIVTYIDSHASQLKAGGYEVFLLMEYCDGGGLIDFMNTRLKNRLTEPEILKIFSDTAEGVACMHYLKPPLLHRDLKVENILISNTSSTKLYKLCDFGSSAPPRPAATSAAEGRLIEDDVQRHTTLQYRSPEMIDVYRKRPIDEKSDIWALGVLLYKLCYYTTPFEQQGQMAILTASFKYPGFPKFSDSLKKLIASMLTQDPQQRPNIYQVLREVCAMRGKEIPIKDIYATRTHSEVRNNQRLPDPDRDANALPQIGASRAAPELVRQELPEVTPMRRGRPTASPQPPATSQQSKTKSDKDPFAALDSPSFSTRSKAVDELSARFPPADQFALLQNKSSTYQFGASKDKDLALNERVTNALADEAFAAPSVAKPQDSSRGTNALAAAKIGSLRKESRPDSPQVRSLQNPPIARPTPEKAAKPETDKPTMVSTGTMTSQPSSPKDIKMPVKNNRPIWRVPPPKPISPSLELALRSGEVETSKSLLSSSGQQRPAYSTSPNDQRDALRSPVSSRPSLEGVRPALLDLPRTIHRSRSAEESSLSPTKSDFSSSDTLRDTARQRDLLESTDNSEDAHIPSNVEFLRAMEEEDAGKSQGKRSSSINRLKHASLPSMPKHMFAGRIGSAFRRFEAGISGDSSPSQDRDSFINDPSISKPNTQGGTGLEDSALEETEDLSPEMRRELERRRLSLEEKRVADAAAAYRQQLVNGGGSRAPGINRASTIQNRVASLLDESGRVSPVKKTAEGYGKYTDSGTLASTSTASRNTGSTIDSGETGSESAVPTSLKAANSQRLARRPVAPPKPRALRTGGGPDTSESKPLASSEGADRIASVDLESDFSKRYPSLSLDMVETEIQQMRKIPSNSSDGRSRDL